MKEEKNFAVQFATGEDELRYVGDIHDFRGHGLPDPVLMTEQEARELVRDCYKDAVEKYPDEVFTEPGQLPNGCHGFSTKFNYPHDWGAWVSREIFPEDMEYDEG